MSNQKKVMNKNSGKKYDSKKYQKKRGFSAQDKYTDTELSKAPDKRNPFNLEAWYNQNPALVDSVASLPTGYALGFPEEFGTVEPPLLGRWADRTANTATKPGEAALPGVMVLDYQTTPGVATGPSAAVNQTMRQLYTFVRHENSGHTNYDGPDLMLYLLAAESPIAFHNFMLRLYNTFFMQDAYSRYLPKALVEAQGFNFEDMQKQLPTFLAYINMYAIRINKLRIPKGLSFFERHIYMNMQYYKDTDAKKAQYYCYKPSRFWIFALDDKGAGKLDQKVFDATDLTTLMQFGDSLIDPLLANEDFNIMSGDILKAYGEEGCFKIPLVDNFVNLIAEHIDEPLMQINNATIVGSIDGSITQETAVGTGYLVFNPTSVVTRQLPMDKLNKRVRIKNNDTRPINLLTTTRLTVIADKYEGGKYTYTSLPSEVINQVRVVRYQMNVEGQLFLNEFKYVDSTTYITNGANGYISCGSVQGLMTINSFNYSPELHVVWMQTENNTKNFYYCGSTAQYDDYATVSNEELKHMHDVALLSEFTLSK